MSWAENLEKVKAGNSFRMILDFQDRPEIKEWVKKQAIRYSCPQSKIVKAILLKAMIEETKNE